MESTYLLVVSLLSIGYLIYKFIEKQRTFWTKYGVPRLEIQGLFTRIWKKTSFVDLDAEMYKQMGNLAYGGYMEGNLSTLLVKDLELIRKIYVKDFEHFVNRRKFESGDKNFRNMLINKEDDEWKDLRSTMSPTFTTGKIRRMFTIFNDSAKQLVTYIKDELIKDKSNSGVVDMEEVLGRYAMNVITSAAFGIDSGIFKDPDVHIAKMAKKIQFKFSVKLMIKFFGSLILPTSVHKYLNLRIIEKDADEYFSKLLKDSIKYRESSGEKRNDFLQLMIEAKHGQLKDETKDTEEMDTYEKDAQLTPTKKIKAQVTDDTIISNCMLFMLGGFDTVSSGLMFGAYAMALNPDIQKRLRQGLVDIAEKRGSELSYDDINQHEYLDKVINETLRMYPPAVRTERRCTKDYPLDDTGKVYVPKDSLVAMPVYQIHHDPTYFPNPEVFDPERFSTEEKSKRSPYVFMPFGHGPRNCIANRFALAELKLVLANLVLNFEIEPCAQSPIPLKFRNVGSLKPIGEMWLKLKSVK